MYEGPKRYDAPALPRSCRRPPPSSPTWYSWIVVSRFSLRRVIVPIVGKLSDLIEARSSVASLSRSDLAVLERIGMAASAALVLDLTEDTS